MLCCCKTSCEFLAATWIKHQNLGAKQSVWFQKQTHSKCAKTLLNSGICRQKWVISVCPKETITLISLSTSPWTRSGKAQLAGCSLWVRSNLRHISGEQNPVLWVPSLFHSVPESQDLSIPCPRLTKCGFLHCCVFKALLPHFHLPSWNYSAFCKWVYKVFQM